MENTYKVNQKVYDIGINVLSGNAEISELTILCIGEKALFVKGLDVVWGSDSESTLFFYSKDLFNPGKVFNTNTHTVWTDDQNKAKLYAGKMNEILQLKATTLKAV